jgi:transketolase
MNIPALENVAKTLRSLSVDAIEAANSGHPGLPMGMAEFGAWLYGEVLKHNPANPHWMNRDRFVISAGHGSMFLYSLLHLSGYELPLEELKAFRQLDSLTPGHPERGHTAGVETTTGPLGQGFANAVGMAIAREFTAAKFNTAEHPIIDHHVYTLAGDGCLMEGISSEAASLAGHLKLGSLVAFYDSNSISIEGSTELAFTEQVAGRFESFGWQVLEADPYDFASMDKALTAALADIDRPSLIILPSVIGKGAPTKAGSHSVHGAPLGAEERQGFRQAMGIPADGDFYIADGVSEYFAGKRKEWQAAEESWDALFEQWSSANPALRTQWDQWHAGIDAVALEELALPEYEAGSATATRASSGKVLQVLAERFTNLLGGSADLAPSNKSDIISETDFSAENRVGRNFHFGVREHAMGAVVNGMALYGGLRVYAATFLVFSDYMRPAIRLAALMKLPVTYIFTHDSIFVGEDGPTHQPIEHLAVLRAIPGLDVLRPADGAECNEAWKYALKRKDGPSVLSLSRQGLTEFDKPEGWRENFARGAYAVLDIDGEGELTVIIATGSELSVALDAGRRYASDGKRVRVVSMPCRDAFLRQDRAYIASVIPAGSRVFAAEAGISMGWEIFTGSADRVLSIDRFGLSAPGKKAAEALGLTADRLYALMNE